MIERKFIAFLLLACLSACGPITKYEEDIGLPYRPGEEREAINVQKPKDSSIPYVTSAAEDLLINKQCIAYGNNVTGLSNAYLQTMDAFFRSFRKYYTSLNKYEEDKSGEIEFEKVQLRPKLTSQQIELTENFRAVPFLDKSQNDFVITSLITLQKRMMDLEPLGTTLQTYVDSKAYESDEKLTRGQELMLQINDHCAEFYETHHKLGDFIQSLQLTNKRPILRAEPDGDASINLLNDLHGLKSVIQRTGNYREESDDIEELIAEYKLLATNLQLHVKYDLELIKNEKTREDYKTFYNGVFSEILPRMNKTIEELHKENLVWLKEYFNKTVEEMYSSYNGLSRFYNEEYGKNTSGE